MPVNSHFNCLACVKIMGEPVAPLILRACTIILGWLNSQSNEFFGEDVSMRSVPTGKRVESVGGKVQNVCSTENFVEAV